MNKDIAIKVENLSKVYKLYNAPIDRMKEALHPRKKSYHKEFYALNDVSFEIKKGEIVGIIGRNGSGKSTILKIITGVLTPTSGKVTVNGRISALLELGAGFNPEYTGMENIYFQGNLMGFEREEMEAKVQAILDFAEIGDFIDQPVKNYSSGMFARLAFAVAINVEPEILIVDEALSVGDAFFQSKCMDRMTNMMQGGTTVLFVSHDISAVRSFCDQAILIENGLIKSYGNVADVTGQYMQDNFLKNNDIIKNEKVEINNIALSESFNELHDSKLLVSTLSGYLHNIKFEQQDIRCLRRFGNEKAQIISVRLLNTEDKPTDIIESCSFGILEVVVKFNENIKNWAIVTPICTLNGVQQFGMSSAALGYNFPEVFESDVYVIQIKHKFPVKDGTYNFTISLEEVIELNVKHEFIDVVEGCLPFSVYWGVTKFPMMFNLENIELELGKVS